MYIISKYSSTGNLLDLDRLSIEKRFKNPEKILDRKRLELAATIERLNALSPKHKLSESKSNLDKIDYRLHTSYENNLTSINNKHRILNEKLILLNPLSILDKGYSVTYKDGLSLKSVDHVEVGDIITTKLSKGTMKSKVLEKEN